MEPVDLCTGDPVMPVDQPAPSAIPERRRAAGGVDDIREQDRSQYAIGILRGFPRGDLLVGPDERLNELTRGCLGAGLVGQQHDARIEHPRMHEP